MPVEPESFSQGLLGQKLTEMEKRLDAIATRVEANTLWLEAIALRFLKVNSLKVDFFLMFVFLMVFHDFSKKSRNQMFGAKRSRDDPMLDPAAR